MAPGGGYHGRPCPAGGRVRPADRALKGDVRGRYHAGAKGRFLSMHARRMVHIAGSRAGIRRANDLFGKFSAAHHLPAGAVWPFQIALDEMLSNIVDHGGSAKPKAKAK